ncbi:MAG: MarR family transcriptional regulator [Acidimicrobiaceae bacterium]|nr:MarR family transcriptional regulator [Acidimicrobiaceae bacterium]
MSAPALDKSSAANDGEPEDSDDLVPPAALEAWAAMRELVLDHERKKEVCEALGLSFVRVRVLLLVAQAPQTMGAIAARLTTDPPYTTLVVDDLERRGLVERRAHPTDRRAKLVALTPSGEEAARRADALVSAPPTRLAALDADDLEVLRTILAGLSG